MCIHIYDYPIFSYGMGWGINGKNYGHAGSLSGSGGVVVRAGSKGDLSWVFLMNKRWVGAADSMMWEVANGIGSWPHHDFF